MNVQNEQNKILRVWWLNLLYNVGSPTNFLGGYHDRLRSWHVAILGPVWFIHARVHFSLLRKVSESLIGKYIGWTSHIELNHRTASRQEQNHNPWHKTIKLSSFNSQYIQKENIERESWTSTNGATKYTTISGQNQTYTGTQPSGWQLITSYSKRTTATQSFISVHNR